MPRTTTPRGLRFNDPLKDATITALKRVIDPLVGLRVATSAKLAAELMRRSPSVCVDSHGKFVALERVFVLPEFVIPRSALIIERYLDTLRRNSSAHSKGTTPLLERNCYVSEMDLEKIVPILRDIKERGTAFMNSVDGDIEAHRIRRFKSKGVGRSDLRVDSTI